MPTFDKTRPVCVFDTECYVNYWSIGFKAVDDGRSRVYELHRDCELNKKAIAKIFRTYTVVGFNSIKYDIPMILYAMSGASNGELKQASDELIQHGTPHWVFMERMGLSIPDFMDHIDLMEVSPGSPTKPSLKIYSGRLHSATMRELPFEIDTHLTPEEMSIVGEYLDNDLQVTRELYQELLPQIDLRYYMSNAYGLDLRSKSDAQAAEAVLKAEIERIGGKRLRKPDIRAGVFKYTPPAFIKFKSPALQALLDDILRTNFHVRSDGVVEMPKWLADQKIELGESVYRLGIGGIHSSEKGVSRYSDESKRLIDCDVSSFYPMIIINNRYYPKQIGEPFAVAYKQIVDERLKAKARAKALGVEIKKAAPSAVEQLKREQRIADTEASSKKLAANGSYGKLGSPYSVLYSPDMMIHTTITGQLSLLMLIEALTLADFSVVSANTDGFVTEVPDDRRDEYDAIVANWEKQTNFETEKTEYKSLHSRDVNSYVAFGFDGKVKLKGAFGPSGPGMSGASGLKKNPDCDIVVDAVVAYLKDGTPIEDTIEWCFDPRKFVTVKRVTGGACKGDAYLGKALRWYYAKGVEGGFHYETNGKLVPDSVGAKLMMTLPKVLPPDVDYDYYVREAYAILDDIGARFESPDDGRRGIVFARLPDAKNIHSVDLATREALCGQRQKSRRDPWIEYKAVPDGHRYCSKCKKANSL